MNATFLSNVITTRTKPCLYSFNFEQYFIQHRLITITFCDENVCEIKNNKCNMRENQLKAIVDEFKRTHHHLFDDPGKHFCGTCKCFLVRNGKRNDRHSTENNKNFFHRISHSVCSRIVMGEYVMCGHCTYNHDVIP